MGVPSKTGHISSNSCQQSFWRAVMFQGIVTRPGKAYTNFCTARAYSHPCLCTPTVVHKFRCTDVTVQIHVTSSIVFPEVVPYRFHCNIVLNGNHHVILFSTHVVVDSITSSSTCLVLSCGSTRTTSHLPMPRLLAFCLCNDWFSYLGFTVFPRSVDSTWFSLGTPLLL